MKKILVPVDFSDVSRTASTFAAALQQELNAVIILLHVVDSTLVSAEGLWIDSAEAAYQVAEQRLHAFATQHFNGYKPMVQKVVRFGVAGFTVVDYARDHSVDYIVTGMRHRHGALEKWLGTTSHTIIKQAPCPVFVVHEHTHWRRPEKWVFTCKSAPDLRGAIPALAPLVRQFHPQGTIVYVSGAKPAAQKDIIFTDIEQSASSPSFPFKWHVRQLVGKIKSDLLVDYALNEKADWLIVTHHDRSAWPWLVFTSTSVSVAEKWHLPLLVLPENTAGFQTTMTGSIAGHQSSAVQ